MSEPRTPTGKRMRHEWRNVDPARWSRDILAIEDEAAAMERERLRDEWADWLDGEFGTASFGRIARVVDALLDDPEPCDHTLVVALGPGQWECCCNAPAHGATVHDLACPAYSPEMPGPGYGIDTRRP